MEIGMLIGLIGGLVLTLISILLNGDMQVSAIISFIDIPSFMITVGGAVTATITAFPLNKFTNALKSVGKIAKPAVIDPTNAIKEIIDLANLARREGLLALDEKAGAIEDQFLKKAVMFVVDGTDPEVVRNVLETEVSFIEDRHKEVVEVWDFIGTQTPAWGMIGTLVGLVMMLQNMDDPSSIGPSMAVALITTFYGSFFANYLAAPFANKMKLYSKQEMVVKEIIIEGILAVAAGENPRMIEEKLKVFISPSLRDGIGEEQKA